jgi:TATA-binding protein-associated factor Taf7
MTSISSISGNSGASPYSTNASDIANLEKQRTKLQDDLKNETASKDDEKTKQQKTDLIQQQIQQIELQIAQKKSNTNAAATPPVGNKDNTADKPGQSSQATSGTNGNSIDMRV